jgi:membrane associated rhomboid family serine protease
VKENNSKLEASIRIFARIVCDFREVFFACALIIVSSIAIYMSFSVYPKINSILAASRATPWGVITSIFVHSSLTHLASNMIWLFLYTLLFAVCNISLASENKRKIEPFFLICVFGSAIVANIFWICLTSERSLGASGVVYAVQGVLLGFSLINGLSISDWKKFKIQEKFTQFLVLFNLLVLISFLFQIVLLPQIFLSVASGVNILVHAISFYLSLVITVVWNGYIKKVSILV